MNIIEKINQNRQFLSPQEGKVCDFIFAHLADYRDFSVKVIAKKLMLKNLSYKDFNQTSNRWFKTVERKFG